MRLNIKDIAKIIDNENIPFSRKQYFCDLYFNNFRAYKTSDQRNALIEILNDKCYYLENETPSLSIILTISLKFNRILNIR